MGLAYFYTGLSDDFRQLVNPVVQLEEVERRYIPHVLDCVGGNKTLAIPGMDRKTLYRKLHHYGAADENGHGSKIGNS